MRKKISSGRCIASLRDGYRCGAGRELGIPRQVDGWASSRSEERPLSVSRLDCQVEFGAPGQGVLVVGGPFRRLL